MFGYIGKLLFVNLSDHTYEIRDLPEEYARNFVGTHGLGAKILYEEMPAHADVFGPDSMIGFISGPVNGSGTMLGGRYAVVSKSPLYNGWNDANCGGHMAPAIRRSGFDGVFVKGISPTPVYILLDDGRVEIRDASHIWGLTTHQTEIELAKELQEKSVNAALIGPAGENLSYMASIMNEGHRAAARGGSGAVMGSKKLKGIVARGKQQISLFDVDTVRRINKKMIQNIKGAPIGQMYSRHGTGGFTVAHILGGDANVKNWSGTGIEDFPEELSEKISSQTMDPLFMTAQYGCDSCPVRCGATYEVKQGKWPIMHSSRPEWETIGAFGSAALNSDHYALCYCNQLCNEYGTDTISTGQTVSWAMECYNNGVLSRDELDGIDLGWGNAEAIVELTEKIVKNQGCGKLLINGSREAARNFGKGHEYLTTSSGLEPPMHDARSAPAWARIYRASPAPGRHTKAGYVTQGKPAEIKYDYKRGTAFDEFEATAWGELVKSSGYCSFLNFFNVDMQTRWEVSRPLPDLITTCGRLYIQE